ncbi:MULTISPECIES: N-acetylglucosamine-6-phosphate deacetylase [Sporosarcina]|uniref:N-acetylglucosamine-6-phosphate deacetylase n=1 Tax=Sporosarcina TaxID=1569 RepID=UPI00129A0C46|nr:MULTISPECIES: amidohydrolase family protein [Sporosarcina]GKV66573.1 N-acetylglucosamine-6-phosphate deacetylase [Sporosarcina sp. NCCP-2331]GLB56850.1 N-acetylglucosamine-6-phosphate deacetylase [Sporosarcina sp. NCCP-2378]
MIKFKGNTLEGKSVEVTIESGLIKTIKDINWDPTLLTIAPGLVDIQINGYKSHDFNAAPLSETDWEHVIQELLNIGVTTFYPTVITNSIERLNYIFQENVDVLSKRPDLVKHIGGFHLEGPFLSLEDGPRGAHEKSFIKKPDYEEFLSLQKSAKKMIKIITMSPEWEGSDAFIRSVVADGVKVAIGHTSANTTQIRNAVESGASISTHLGNGAHVLMKRHPNYIWDQLAEDALWTSVIADGNHLPENVIKVMKRVKGKKLILVSDSVALAGMPAGKYQASVGGSVTLTESGRLQLSDQPELLAGSAQNLLQGIEFLVKNNIDTLDEAIRRSSIFPAKFMGLEFEGLKVGAKADLVLLNTSGTVFEVEVVFKEGILRKGEF